jgi:4-hydroxy-tetrahydrodipicolinate synthase
LIVPILTPFAKDGAVDGSAFAAHLEFLGRAGVSRVLVGGTTGEFFSLSVEERLMLLDEARKRFDRAVLFQVGGGALPEALHLMREAASLGADGLLCLPPSYYAAAPTEGVTAYFRAVAEQSDLPLMLYNFPKHTGNPITPEILAAVPHAALKDSSGNLSLIAHTPLYFVGGDAKILDAATAGAVGFVSAVSNVDPAPFVRLEEALVGGRSEEAATLHAEIMAIPVRLGVQEIPASKYVLSRAVPGYPTGVRPPLTPLPAELAGKLHG